MRPSSAVLPIIATITVSTAAFQLRAPFSSQFPISKPTVDNEKDRPPSIMPDGPLLNDLLPTTRTTSIFASLTRSVDSVDKALARPSSKGNYTVLAPSNAALHALPQKPWEDNQDYETLGAQAYEGGDGEERAQRNLRRFVEAHVVVMEDGEGSWKEGEQNRRKTVLGEELWWETKNDKKMIHPGEVEVESEADKVANGELWVLKGVVNYKSPAKTG